MPPVIPAHHDQPVPVIERPDPALLKYYLLSALVVPPLFPLVAVPLWFRYHTLRYRLTDDGISMSWGILFRRQIIVNYERIQDIHLRSNVVERWLGLARVMIQTASGSAASEMTIEGLNEFEALRDFLYSRMRGVKDHPPAPASATGAGDAELAATLRATAAELREIRLLLARRTGAAPEDPPRV